MNCPKCDVKMQKIKTKEVFYGNIAVENIDALKCKKCGEVFFDENAYDSTVKKLQEIKEKIPVSVLAKIKMLFL